MTNKQFARLALLASASVACLGLLTGASPAGAKTVTKTATVSQCVNSATLISDDVFTPDGAAKAVMATVPVNVPRLRRKPQAGRVTDLASVGVRITHVDDGDLNLLLVAPGGRAIVLAHQKDDSVNGSGDGYGSGATNCTGSLVHFGDSFSRSILAPGNTGPNSPITGSFVPEQLLNTLVGGPADGNWSLVVFNNSNTGGAVDAFSLSLTYQYKALKKKKKRN